MAIADRLKKLRLRVVVKDDSQDKVVGFDLRGRHVDLESRGRAAGTRGAALVWVARALSGCVLVGLEGQRRVDAHSEHHHSDGGHDGDL